MIFGIFDGAFWMTIILCRCRIKKAAAMVAAAFFAIYCFIPDTHVGYVAPIRRLYRNRRSPNILLI